MRATQVLALLGFCLMTLGWLGTGEVSRARAQEAETDLTDEEARSLFEAGRAAFTAGRFEDALGHFQRAYELSGRPMLLFNIGQSFDRLRRDEEALSTFERYLTDVPDAPNRAQVEARVAIMQAAVAEAEEQAELRALDTPPDSVGAEESEGDPAAPDSPSRRRPFAWVSAGASVGFVGLAATFWLLGDGEYDDLAQSCGTRGCTDEEIDASSLHTFDVLTNVSIALSVAAAATSIVLFIVEDSAGEDVAVSVSPQGLSLRGSF